MKKSEFYVKANNNESVHAYRYFRWQRSWMIIWIVQVREDELKAKVKEECYEAR